MIRAGKIDATIGLLIAQIPDKEKQKEALNVAMDEDRWNGPMSFRDVQEMISRRFQKGLKDVPWDVADKTLLPKAGSCKECPLRSGNLADFPEAKKSPNICTDVNCFEKKRAAHTAVKLAEAEQRGLKTMGEKEYGRVRYSSAYVDLADSEYFSNKSEKWSKILNGTNVVVTVAVDDQGQVHELVPRAAAMKIAAEQGFKTDRGMSDSGKKEAREKKERKRTYGLAIDMAGGEILKKIQGLKPELFWRFMLDSIARSMACYGDAGNICKLLGLDVSENDSAHGKLESHLSQLKEPAQMRQAAVAILMSHDQIGQWSGELGENMEQAAELCGEDLKKLAKEFEKPEKKVAEKAAEKTTPEKPAKEKLPKAAKAKAVKKKGAKK